jgi:hypothetical protein
LSAILAKAWLERLRFAGRRVTPNVTVLLFLKLSLKGSFMSSIGKLLTFGVIALGFVVASAATASAQWTVGYQPYTTYYAPAATAYSTYYAPTAYQTYYAPSAAAYQTYYAPATTTTPVVYTSGWYPGYWFDRARAAVFGRPAVVTTPTTYVASYPTTYAASYPATYTASYPASYAASYPVAAPACSSCAPAQQVTMRPVCAPACATCEPCTNCTTTVTPTSYVEQPQPCTNCSTGITTSPSPTPAVSTQTFETQQPGLNPTEQVPSTRAQKPAESSGGTNPSETPSSSQSGSEASTTPNTDSLEKYLGEEKNSAEYFQAPKLFDPTDKTVKLSPAPIHMAVYKRSAGESPDHSIQARPISITVEKARRDAIGWTSAK